ncbi:LytR/AlgR family response regulator transcription factor [Chitinophaga sancti]|uniref:LytTR family DNA-binding domain-containing protein n=1 Tax=Chitinophaga sancti TaxID=1004 RepID=A0A1K1S4Y7_9BACT|nr:LytTR family DNA-binding domain-containing protein [Chitinophaga sancti]WQD63750.1 LytTR family DNA-binding domain-containing protein [Chitinophaga sancti]WQG90625.1 LytTR family DNA-binding domain-containing protein [Chitinophaga sancti]SFW79085.1 two component transcriptional regulator, LytTR family [Chitinophaga sancti]
MNVIIIEDERKTARELQDILTSIDSGICILEVLPSVASAIRWFRENPAPDLIFSDIQLGDGLCFEIYREVAVNAPIIFCTAFDQYAIQSFESNSIDYLLKPLEEAVVERSLKKFHRIKDHYNTYQQSLNKAMTQVENAYRQTILVHYREKMVPVKVADLAFIHAANGVVTLHTRTGQDYTVQYTIDQLENMLNRNDFFRANRQFILHRESITDIEHYFNRRLTIRTNCKTPEKIIVSRLKAQDFLRWIEQ